MQFRFKEEHIEGALQFGDLVISGNEEHGFRPYELLVSSIAGCSGLVFKKILTKQRVELDTLVIDAEVERNKEKANRVEKISLHFKVKATNIKLEKLERNLKIAQKNCAMVQSVKGSIDIVEKVSLLD